MSNIKDNANTMLYNTIHSYGRTLTIFYTTSAYPYSGFTGHTVDPVNNEPISYLYSTATGAQATAVSIKAVINGFVGAMSYSDQLLAKQGYFQDSDVRATCWLADVLLNECSVSGVTYFDKSQKVKIENHYYKVKRTYRTGLDRPSLIIIALNEIENTI